MPKKWYNIAKKNLKDNDEINKSYTGRLDNENGYLVLSNKRLQFVQEDGLFTKKYGIKLDLPYDKLSKISHIDNSEIDIIDSEGKEHGFKPDAKWNNIETLEDEIRKFAENSS